MKKTVIVGLSGGVDSAVTAYLLKEKGYNVIGISLINSKQSAISVKHDAQNVADFLEIEYHAVNIQEDFNNTIINYMIEEYCSGKTPNPCIYCNKSIKFKYLIDEADQYGADYIATGHYANIKKLDNGRLTIEAATDKMKDQTYFLYQLTQQQLSKTLFPLSQYTKDEVRQIARKASIPVSEKKDSQEICFIPDNNYAGFILNHLKDEPKPGNFIDETGKVLGKHKGIFHYTIGQRKGLQIALGTPVFVKKIDTETNNIILSDDNGLYSNTVTFSKPCFMSIDSLDDEIVCFAKIRYRHKGGLCRVRKISNNKYEAYFDEPVRAAANGQAIVLYDKNHIIGGGIIDNNIC